MSSDYKAKEAAEAVEVVRALSHYANHMGVDYKPMVEALMREHRTLQQSIFGLVLQLLKAWADCCDNERYDLRNEFACKKAKEIMDKVFEGGQYLGVPFI